MMVCVAVAACGDDALDPKDFKGTIETHSDGSCDPE